MDNYATGIKKIVFQDFAEVMEDAGKIINQYDILKLIMF
jgi:hypothetical protein